MRWPGVSYGPAIFCGTIEHGGSIWASDHARHRRLATAAFPPSGSTTDCRQFLHHYFLALRVAGGRCSSRINRHRKGHDIRRWEGHSACW